VGYIDEEGLPSRDPSLLETTEQIAAQSLRINDRLLLVLQAAKRVRKETFLDSASEPCFRTWNGIPMTMSPRQRAAVRALDKAMRGLK